MRTTKWAASRQCHEETAGGQPSNLQHFVQVHGGWSSVVVVCDALSAALADIPPRSRGNTGQARHPLRVSLFFREGPAGSSRRRDLARLAMHIIVKQIFEDGFFHADPHPGNVLVLGTAEQPQYALIDLGMGGRLGPRMRDLTVDLMVAGREDYDAVADAMYAIATPTRKVDMRAYRSQVALLAEKYLKKNLRDIELSALISDLISTATRYGLEVPPDFVLVGKALITIEGVGKEIAPDFDIVAESRPLFLELLRKRYSPQRIGNELLRRMERLSGATSQLPEQFGEVLEDLRMGRLAIRTTDTEIAEASDRLGRRIFSAVLASACLLSGTALLLRDHGELGTALILLALVGVVFHWLSDNVRRFRRRR
ncbi:MAG: AarF/UbiB family protein [Deltaproteobacteria bacterium]